MAPPDKRRIVILGGGPGGIATAFALTRNPADRQRLDVTVYQPGWRLGGKCASGFGSRIEEHGLHVWAGFYDNAFQQLIECYGELGLNWESVFHGLEDFVLREWHDGKWKAWPIHLPRNPAKPGRTPGRQLPTLWDLFDWLAVLIRDSIAGQEELRGLEIDRFDAIYQAAKALDVHGTIPWERAQNVVDEMRGKVPLVARRAGRVVKKIFDKGPRFRRLLVNCRTIATVLIEGIVRMARDPASRGPAQHRAIRVLLDAIESALVAFESSTASTTASDQVRRAKLVVRTAIAILKGIVDDDLLRKGLDKVDLVELRDWLRAHGARPDVVDSAIVRAGYDWSFAYDGDTPSISAAVALQGFLRLAIDYRGAAFWQTSGSLGDLVYAPMYRLLEKRGVKFRFFHRTTKISLDATGTSVAKVELVEQARTTGGARYEALVPHPKNLPHSVGVWPPFPRVTDLENGELLRQKMAAGQVDLESGADDDAWEERKPVVLVHRRDAKAGDEIFDEVVIAFPPATQQVPCAPLKQARPAWKDMLDGLRSARTLAMQLWLQPTLAEIGHPGPGVLTTACPWPFSTWADMSHLVQIEPAPAGGLVRSIVYLCGNAPADTPVSLPQARQFAHESAVRWLDEHAGAMWPNQAPPPPAPGTFDYQILHDPQGGHGKARLDSQYIRANVRPSDLYVLSMPGTTRLRMAANGSGIGNLHLAGDWVLTSLPAGCVEAAVTAGEDAAAAILTKP
jgi:uncharacterized protein with NAD-binding domain and iron-sulfur cluster